MSSIVNSLSAQTSERHDEFRNNKKIPAVIEKSVLKALSFYPELKNTRIKFVFKKKLRGSVMQAQPLFTSLLRHRTKRSYQINISALFRLTHTVTPIHQLPDEIMIGWIGHELGHIMDYESRSNRGLVVFGYQYLRSGNYVKKVEVIADTYAVNHGLGSYIIATKRFILDHAELPQAYKEKISRLYLSPDDIVEQVRKLEERRAREQTEASK
ncbi:MAG: hypothetical protein EOO04_22455 [Chitinophagaceae bacterium]|nr:MAG: hypothetical protein EOO04_22455 [Chitinophagaceae bacterium]